MFGHSDKIEPIKIFTVNYLLMWLVYTSLLSSHGPNFLLWMNVKSPSKEKQKNRHRKKNVEEKP